jgi:hypothetical protein
MVHPSKVRLISCVTRLCRSIRTVADSRQQPRRICPDMTRLVLLSFLGKSERAGSACMQLCQHAGLSDTRDSSKPVLERRSHDPDGDDDRNECILIRVIRKSCICVVLSATV